jgi:uncharacterized protein YukE
MYFELPSVEAILKELFGRRWTIAGITLLFTVASVLRVLLTPDEFESETTLLITSVPTKSDTALADTLPEVFHPPVYEALAKSRDVLGQTHTSLLTAQAWGGNPPELRRFSQQLTARVQMVDETTRPMNFAPLLTLKAVGESPEQSSLIVDTWADVLLGAARKATRYEVAGAQQVQEKNRDMYLSLLEDTWAAKREQMSKADPELLRETISARVQTIQSVEEQLAQAQAEFASATQGLDAVVAALSDESERIELRRAPGDTEFWLSQQEGETSQSALTESVMVTEVMNPEYTRLIASANSLRETAASEQARVEALRAELASLVAQQDAARKSLAESEEVFAQVDSQLSYLNRAYQELAGHEATLQTGAALSTTESDGINPIGLNRLSDTSYAVEAQSVVGGKVLVVVAAILGFCVALVFVMGRFYWDFMAGRIGQATPS